MRRLTPVVLFLCGAAALAFTVVRAPVAPGVRQDSRVAVALIDGAPIAVEDVVRALEASRSLGRARDDALAATSPGAALAVLRAAVGTGAVDDAVERAIDTSLARAAAAKVGPIAETELDARLLVRRRRLERPAQPTLEDLWARRGGLAALRGQLAVEAALDQLAGVPTADEVARSFEARRDFFSGRRLRVAHVLVATEERAVAARTALQAGATWEEVCARDSIDKETRGAGGDAGWTRREGDLPDALAAAAFALAKGAVGGPVKTSYGWHLVRWTDEQPGTPVVLDAVRDFVVEDLARERRLAFVRELRAKAKVERTR